MDIKIDFFNIGSTRPEKGKILISEPFTSDTYFSRSVVLLTKHSEKGSVGFILNLFSNIKLNEAIKEISSFKQRVSLGGPVQTNTLHYIHTLGDLIPESIHIKDNLYWGGDFEYLKALLSSGNIRTDQIRFFAGYSGWEPGQLEEELTNHYWLVSDIPEENIMQKNINLWEDSLKIAGGKYKAWINAPIDPGLN